MYILCFKQGHSNFTEKCREKMPTICMNIIILFSLISKCIAAPIFFVSESAIQDTVLTHPAVLINSAMEDNLPSQLRNDFYKNPNIAAGLAKESWFIDKEMQVQYFHNLSCQVKFNKYLFSNI